MDAQTEAVMAAFMQLSAAERQHIYEKLKSEKKGQYGRNHRKERRPNDRR